MGDLHALEAVQGWMLLLLGELAVMAPPPDREHSLSGCMRGASNEAKDKADKGHPDWQQGIQGAVDQQTQQK